MAPNSFVKNFLLLPMSKLYGLGVGIRNLMFKWHILKQREFSVPVIVVGNLSVGGTGKTPHTEYIINLLRGNYHIGMVSRGYKRKTKGFVLATNRSTPLDIGDEPYQIFQKYGRDISVAVGEDRCEAIEKLLEIDPKINLIVLDDALQHKYVKPTVVVLLTEFNRPIFYDNLLPLGRLREPMKEVYKADFVVVTKCPEYLKPIEYRIFQNKLDLQAYQHLMFSKFEYQPLRAVFPEQSTDETVNLNWYGRDDSILVVSGIANPRPLVRYLREFGPKVKVKVFADHHNFTRKDLDLIENTFKEMPGEEKIIVTTEKDAVRLANNPYFPQSLKKYIYYQPIVVKFDEHTSENFDYELKKVVKERTILK